MNGDIAYIAVVAGIASALGGLIGTLATMWVAKKQIHAQVVLAERMKWIADLRNTIAEFQTAQTELFLAWEGTPDPEVEDILNHQAMGRGELARRRALLLINPVEHKDLETVLIGAGTDQVGRAKNLQHLNLLTKVARPILKREWERVKRGD